MRIFSTWNIKFLGKRMILDRIKEYIDHKGISISAFEKSIGMSNASFGKSLKNKGAIGTDKLEKILITYPDLSHEWLLTGRGEMLADGGEEQPKHTAHLADNQQEGIPLIPIDAMAGALVGETVVLDYECERYVVPAFKGADFLIRINGSSMYPSYRSGDIVACQRVPMTDLFFQWNRTYVIDTNQGALIKRIKPGSDRQHVLIVSDNKDYDPFELPMGAIYAVALVIGTIRLE